MRKVLSIIWYENRREVIGDGQHKGCDSPSPRYVKRVFRKRKDHRLGKINVKVPHQGTPYAMKI